MLFPYGHEFHVQPENTPFIPELWVRRHHHLHRDTLRSVWNHGLLCPIHGRFLFRYRIHPEPERGSDTPDHRILRRDPAIRQGAVRDPWSTNLAGDPVPFPRDQQARPIPHRSRMGTPGRRRDPYGNRRGYRDRNPGYRGRNLPKRKWKRKENKHSNKNSNEK